jgi:hypothetical protein
MNTRIISESYNILSQHESGGSDVTISKCSSGKYFNFEVNAERASLCIHFRVPVGIVRALLGSEDETN